MTWHFRNRLHAQNLADSWDEAGSIAQGEAQVYAMKSQFMIPFQFQQLKRRRGVGGGAFTFSQPLRLSEAPEECFPGGMSAQALRIPPETPTAHREVSLSASPLLLPQL